MISLTKKQMESSFVSFCEAIFRLPEIESIKVRTVTIRRGDLHETAKEAVAIGYHDCYSDTDMSLNVCLPADGSVTSEAYIKRIDRLAAEFYPAYKGRSADFFAIWECYDRNRLQQA